MTTEVFASSVFRVATIGLDLQKPASESLGSVRP
jgi:hypothetical protein